MAHTAGVGPATQIEDGGGAAAATLNGTTAGRGLIALLYWGSTSVTLSSVTVSGESNMTLLTTNTSAGLTMRHCIAYLTNNTGGGNKTITANWSSGLSAAGQIWVKEYVGGDLADWFDVEGTNAGTGATAQVTLSSGSDNALIIGIVTAQTDKSAWTVNSGYTPVTLTDIVHWDNGLEDLDVGGAGSQTPGYALGSSVAYLVTVAVFHAAPTNTFEQSAYRFRADDGNESGASSLAAENTGVSNAIRSHSVNTRLRVQVNTTDDEPSSSFRLEFRDSLMAAWTAVSDVSVPFAWAASANIAGSAATDTTAQLTAPSGKTTSDFVAGKISDDTNPITGIDITTTDYTELEWCIQASTAVVPGTIYQFRVTDNGTVFDSYAQVPSWSFSRNVPRLYRGQA